jgi:predicted site-specific integrase-resolvase
MTRKKSAPHDLVGATVAARILKVDHSHVSRYRDRGELPAITVEGTGRLAYLRSDVEALAEVIRKRRAKREAS